MDCPYLMYFNLRRIPIGYSHHRPQRVRYPSLSLLVSCWQFSRFVGVVLFSVPVFALAPLASTVQHTESEMLPNAEGLHSKCIRLSR